MFRKHNFLMCMWPYHLPFSPHCSVLSAQLWEAFVLGKPAPDERCCATTELSDDGVAGAERHIKIAGILRMFSVRLNSKNRSHQRPTGKMCREMGNRNV